MPEPRAALRAIAEKITGPCICHAAYKDRGMSQSDCPRCEYADEIAQALTAVAAQERERMWVEGDRVIDLICASVINGTHGPCLPPGTARAIERFHALRAGADV